MVIQRHKFEPSNSQTLRNICARCGLPKIYEAHDEDYQASFDMFSTECGVQQVTMPTNDLNLQASATNIEPISETPLSASAPTGGPPHDFKSCYDFFLL